MNPYQQYPILRKNIARYGLAPTNGGMRWSPHTHNIFEFRFDDAAADNNEYCYCLNAAPARPEPEGMLAPENVATPPAEARVGEEYVYQARFLDCVASHQNWYFEKCPDGMTVERYDGLVTWTPTEGGYHEVTICARSVYGMVSRQSWTILVRRPVAVRAAVPNPRFQAALRRKAAIVPKSPQRRPMRPACLIWFAWPACRAWAVWLLWREPTGPPFRALLLRRHAETPLRM